MTFDKIKQLAAAKGIKITNGQSGEYIYFPTETHWVKIYTQLEGKVVMEKESRQADWCTRRKAKDTCTLEPSGTAIRRTINSFKPKK